MFTNFSKAGVGAAIIVMLEAIYPAIGLDVPEGATANFVEAVVAAIGFLLLIWGQLDRPDLDYGLLRKQPKL